MIERKRWPELPHGAARVQIRFREKVAHPALEKALENPLNSEHRIPAIPFGLTLVFGWRGFVWSQLLSPELKRIPPWLVQCLLYILRDLKRILVQCKIDCALKPKAR
jgi:hypothetical protein